MESLVWFSLIVTSYLIGGIPTAYLVTRFLAGQDIRQIGDRNAGAANVFRNVSPKAGFLVGALDIFKGALAIFLVRGLLDSTPLEMLAGAAVLAGHNWPAHFGFRGGKGAATSIGVLLAMLPLLAVPVGALTLAVLLVSKRAMSALGFFLIIVPLMAWPAGYSYPIVLYSLAMPLVVGLTHLTRIKDFSGESLDQQQPEEAYLPQG